MNIYMDGSYLKSNPTWHAQHSSWKADKILKMLNRHDIKPKTICEIGCGSGEILKALSYRMNNEIIFHGYDISPDAYFICSSGEHDDNVSFYLEDFTKSSNMELYDLMLLIDVIEHIEDYIGFLKNIKTKATYKLFHVPLDMSVQSVLRSSAIMDLRNMVGHIHYFSKDTALASLRDSGYQIIDYFYTHVTLEIKPDSIKSRLMRLPRRFAFQLNEDIGIRLLGGASLMILTI